MHYHTFSFLQPCQWRRMVAGFFSKLQIQQNHGLILPKHLIKCFKNKLLCYFSDLCCMTFKGQCFICLPKSLNFGHVLSIWPSAVNVSFACLVVWFPLYAVCMTFRHYLQRSVFLMPPLLPHFLHILSMWPSEVITLPVWPSEVNASSASPVASLPPCTVYAHTCWDETYPPLCCSVLWSCLLQVWGYSPGSRAPVWHLVVYALCSCVGLGMG